MKISINKTKNVIVQGNSATDKVTNQLNYSFYRNAIEKWREGTITLEEKQFNKDGMIYELTESILNNLQDFDTESKLYSKGELATIFTLSKGLVMYRKKSDIDKTDRDQLEPLVNATTIPSSEESKFEGTKTKIVTKTFDRHKIASRWFPRYIETTKLYLDTGELYGQHTWTYWLTTHHPEDLNLTSEIIPDRDQNYTFTNEQGNNVLGTKHDRTAVQIDDYLYKLIYPESKNLYPWNTYIEKDNTDINLMEKKRRFYEAWELAVDSKGEKLVPYFLVGADNRKSINDKSLLTTTKGTDVWFEASGECFNKVALLRTKFKEVCITASDKDGHAVNVIGKKCRTLADEQKMAYAELVCPTCDNLPNTPECEDPNDYYDVIFELENYTATNVEIGFKGDVEIGGVFLGQSYEVNCLLWGITIEPISSSYIEKNDTGLVSRVEGVVKRQISFPLKFPTGFTDLHARFFAKHVSDFVLIEGTPFDGANPEQKLYFNSLNLFCYIVSAPMTLSNLSRSNLILNVEEVLKWD